MMGEAPMVRRTTREALERWDAGEMIPAIKVESEENSQETIYARAFEFIRRWAANEAPSMESLRAIAADLTNREFEAAHSIAHVASMKGWSAMLDQHEHASIKPITIQKPGVADKTPAPTKA